MRFSLSALQFGSDTGVLGGRGWIAHPAGRSPNSSSLHLPLAAVVAVAPDCFCAVFSDVAAAVRIHPWGVKLEMPDKTKNQRIFYTGSFGGRGWITRAALLKTAHWAVFALSSATAPQLFESTRSMSLALLQNKNLSVLVYVEVFWWARVDVASRASKKAPQGLFSPPDYSAGRCCSNPPSRVRLKMPGKTKNQRNFYAGPFGGAKQPKSEPLPSGASLAAISSKVMVFVPSL